MPRQFCRRQEHDQSCAKFFVKARDFVLLPQFATLSNTHPVYSQMSLILSHSQSLSWSNVCIAVLIESVNWEPWCGIQLPNLRVTQSNLHVVFTPFDMFCTRELIFILMLTLRSILMLLPICCWYCCWCWSWCQRLWCWDVCECEARS